MDSFRFNNVDHISMIEEYLGVYLKSKPPDCILYSQDGWEFKIHKEVLSQTSFLREILSSAKEHCCGIVEVFCPCTQKELGNIIEFLYKGEINLEKETDFIKIQENLCEIFGFSKNLCIKNPNQALSHDQNCSLDTEFEAVEEKIEISFDENSENNNLNNGTEYFRPGYGVLRFCAQN